MAVGLLTGYYVENNAHEPLWLMLPASFVAAFFVVAVMVAAAALLRFPWWLLAPLTAISMAFEWALRRIFDRPWQRRRKPRTPFLSNPFAWWQRRRLRQRRRSQQVSRIAVRPQAIVLPFPKTPKVKASPRLEVPQAPLGASVLDYVLEVFDAHLIFWMFAIPVGVFFWLWLGEAVGFFLALIITFLLTVIFMPFIGLAAAVLAGFSATLVGLGLTPQQRYKAIAQSRPLQVVMPPPKPSQPMQAPTPAAAPAASGNRWLWPLLIGLIIGNAWGDDG
ncbi:MAG: hypothetical protein ACPL3S_00510 [Halothiobacillaceae bacterium]